MTGHWWLDWLIGIAGGLVLAWLILVVALAIVRPRGGMLREAMRLLPDVIRLIHRLAADKTLPRGVRIRLGLLLAYLAMPIDLIPDFIPVLGYADDAIIVTATCAASSSEPASMLCGRSGPVRTTASLRCVASPDYTPREHAGLLADSARSVTAPLLALL